MASHNSTITTTSTTIIQPPPGRRGSRSRHIANKQHGSTTISSLLFNDQLRLTTTLPSLNLLSPPSPPQALFSTARSINPWTTAPDTSAVLQDEPTRVRLQRQRLKELHAGGHLNTKFPAFKTSAAFFASLRTNLCLNIAPPDSPMSTPPSMRASATSLPPPSPLLHAAEATAEAPTIDDPLAGVPELSSYRTESRDDKIAALKLVADSMAQMRQTANNHLILHPLLLSVFIPILALFARISSMYGRDWIMIVLGSVGLFMTFFAGCRFATQAYLNAAESITWDWLGDADVLVTKFGDEIIGTVIIEWVSGESRTKRKKAWRGEIKAWTVRLKYRGKGVGTALLEDAAQEAHNKGAESLEFPLDHANSLRPLPRLFNKPFDKQDATARILLLKVLEGNSSRAKRR